jgi:hypothetical protein
VDFSNLRNVDGAGPVDSEMQILADLAPSANEDLIAGANGVVGRDRNVLDGCKRIRNLREQVRPVDRHDVPNGSGNERLEFGERLRLGGDQACLPVGRVFGFAGIVAINIRCVSGSGAKAAETGAKTGINGFEATGSCRLVL